MAFNSSPNYELKALAIKDGVVNEVKYLKRAINKAGDNYLLRDNLTKQFINKLNENPIFLEGNRVLQSTYQRNSKLKKRIYSMLKKGKCIFLTLTFKDDVLQSTNEETRRKYVTRFLKFCSSDYVANIDYGKLNEREHYHAVVLADKVNYSSWHQFGAIKGEVVRNSNNDVVKLSKYVSKLTNHAVKNTNKRCVVIYSKLPRTNLGCQ